MCRVPDHFVASAIFRMQSLVPSKQGEPSLGAERMNSSGNLAVFTVCCMKLSGPSAQIEGIYLKPIILDEYRNFPEVSLMLVFLAALRFSGAVS